LYLCISRQTTQSRVPVSGSSTEPFLEVTLNGRVIQRIF